MRAVLIVAAAGAAALSEAQAQADAAPYAVSCVRDADTRTISVISPGEVGVLCDVQYVRENGNSVRTPYHADNSAGFCRLKADQIVRELIEAGFACGQTGGVLTAEAHSPAPDAGAAPAPRSDPPAASPAASPAPTPAASASDIASRPQPAPGAVRPGAPTTIIVESRASETPAADGGAGDDFETSVLPDLEKAIREELVKERAGSDSLTEPRLDGVATGEPATLADGALEDVRDVASSASTGRLIGAAPSAPAAQPTPAAAPAKASAPSVREGGATIKTAGPAPKAAAAPVPAAARPAAQPSATGAMRSPEDIIVATLKAQAAAWNEGDLSAFMDYYWKDDALKFVNGSAVSLGWNAVMRRYRNEYGGESDLGRLSMEKTDVTLLTDDVAVVTGRFNLARAAGPSSGFFTLVMKRVNGVWRIAHDHTVADPVSAP